MAQIEILINAMTFTGQVLSLALLAGCAVHGFARLLYMIQGEQK